MIRPPSRFPPSDKTLLGVLDPEQLWQGCREIRKMKSKAFLIVEKGHLTLSHRLVGRSKAKEGNYGKISGWFMAELSKACRKIPLNDAPKGYRQRKRYAPAVQIRVEHKEGSVTITAGGTIFTIETGEHSPL